MDSHYIEMATLHTYITETANNTDNVEITIEILPKSIESKMWKTVYICFDNEWRLDNQQNVNFQ